MNYVQAVHAALGRWESAERVYAPQGFGRARSYCRCILADGSWLGGVVVCLVGRSGKRTTGKRAVGAVVRRTDYGEGYGAPANTDAHDLAVVRWG